MRVIDADELIRRIKSSDIDAGTTEWETKDILSYIDDTPTCMPIDGRISVLDNVTNRALLRMYPECTSWNTCSGSDTVHVTVTAEVISNGKEILLEQ